MIILDKKMFPFPLNAGKLYSIRAQNLEQFYAISRLIRERFDNHLCDYFPVGIREKSNHSVIALDRKQHILKIGEIELDESYFGAKRVRGNDIKSSRIKREVGVAHTAKFHVPVGVREDLNSIRLMRECLISIRNAKAWR